MKIALFRKLLVAVATVFLIAFSIQLFLFLNRDVLLSSFTAASEDQLYAGSLNIINIVHIGSGKIRIELDKKSDSVSAVRGSNGAILRVLDEAIEVQLAPGISDVNLRLMDREEQLVFEYTAKEVYTKGGLSAFPQGVVALRSSTMHIGQPVLRDIADWNPSSTSTTTSTSSSTSNHWMQAESEMIIFLEDRRGVPNDAAEKASTKNLVSMIENKTSQVWCSQIARYVVNKLSDQTAVRLLGSGGELSSGHVRTGGHVFLEVLDPISNRWVFSDPTSYVVGVYWQDGMPVSAIEFQHMFGLRNQKPLEDLQFFVVDIKSKKMVQKSWHQLPENIRSDWAFNLSPRNRIFYLSGLSFMHDRSLYNKIQDWIRTDRRFVLSPSNSLPVLAVIRVWSFWVMIISGLVFAAEILAKLYLTRRNRFRP